MDNRIKVLLLVAEPWRSDDSGGNTLNNFVEGMDGVEFAQIYCDDRMPVNAICHKYYHDSVFQKKTENKINTAMEQNLQKYIRHFTCLLHWNKKNKPL